MQNEVGCRARLHQPEQRKYAKLQPAGVAIAAVVPSGEPALFLATTRGVGNTAAEDALGSGRELDVQRDAPVWAGGDFLKDLKQPPALAVVAFGGAGALAFEIHIVDEAKGSLRGGHQGLENGLHRLALRPWGGGEHFGQGPLEAEHDKFSLLTDAAAEECPQLGLARTFFIGIKSSLGRPGAWTLRPGWDGDAPGGQEGHERGEAFLKGAAAAFGIPDKVTDAEGGKVFPAVPTGQPRDGASAFILPDTVAHTVDLGG